ncbi:hypothetical protein PPERSA_06731 [Pseudocohnilembus persalinus]|uniref:Glutamine amidotransferase domain-containing protein n=1 Tax=Pseudocohnilembus persalinus TaxID=266149 RepID=A0A0V0QS35_PSEPJ|nr:hypothetical protein PPERSA_06731 [Pseudocohnilembus persalinus]|eukprot:KRX05097.1 hypothetical protein PPERSA_06731 [Pseudocohnilembus persalinus]
MNVTQQLEIAQLITKNEKDDQTEKSDNSCEKEETQSENKYKLKVQQYQQKQQEQEQLEKQDENQNKVLQVQEYVDEIDPQIKARLVSLEQIEFYAHCKMYLDYLENFFKDYQHISTLQIVEIERKNQKKLNAYLKRGFSQIKDTYEDQNTEYMIQCMQKRFADYHNACAEKNIVLTPLNSTQPYKSIKEALVKYIEELVGLEISREVVDNLENFYIQPKTILNQTHDQDINKNNILQNHNQLIKINIADLESYYQDLNTDILENLKNNRIQDMLQQFEYKYSNQTEISDNNEQKSKNIKQQNQRKIAIMNLNQNQMWDNMYEALYQGFWQQENEVWDVYFPPLDQFPQNAEIYDIIIFSGGHYSCLQEFEWLQKLNYFFQNLVSQNFENLLEKLGRKQKIVSICLGHQAITKALGGTVKRIQHGGYIQCDSLVLKNQNNLQEVEFLENNQNLLDLIKNENKQIKIAKTQSDMVSQLPKNTVHLSFQTGDNEVYYKKQSNQQILSMQFHPEFNWTIVNFMLKKLIPNYQESKEYEKAQQTFENGVDQKITTQFVFQFISQ